LTKQPDVGVHDHRRADGFEQREIGDAVAVERRVGQAEPFALADPPCVLELAAAVAQGFDRTAGEAPVLDLELGAHDAVDTELAGKRPCGVTRCRRHDGHEVALGAVAFHGGAPGVLDVLQHVLSKKDLAGFEQPALFLAAKMLERAQGDTRRVDDTERVLGHPPADLERVFQSDVSLIAAITRVEARAVLFDQRLVHVEQRSAASHRSAV